MSSSDGRKQKVCYCQKRLLFLEKFVVQTHTPPSVAPSIAFVLVEPHRSQWERGRVIIESTLGFASKDTTMKFTSPKVNLGVENGATIIAIAYLSIGAR